MTHEAVIRALHQAGHQLVLSITGGGSAVIGQLLRVPGASQSILEAIVPYSCASQVAWLGGTPDQFVSAATGRAMAMASFWQARRLAGAAVEAQQLIGIGCTASLASDRPKKGDHRAYIGVQTAAYTRTCSITLAKDARTRAEEEDLVAAWILSEAARAAGVADTFPSLDLAGDSVTIDHDDGSPQWQSLLLERSAWSASEAAEPLLQSGQPLAIFPGAFNPRHAGHEAMAALAVKRLQRPVVYELCIANVDKPPLNYTDLRERTVRFDQQPLVLTRAPTFVEKSELFPGATFLVGADTIVRVAQPKYYGGDERVRDEAIDTLRSRGCRFLVFGRVTGSAFCTLAQLALPDGLQAICDQVAETDFRADVSSTQLRREHQSQSQ